MSKTPKILKPLGVSFDTAMKTIVSVKVGEKSKIKQDFKYNQKKTKSKV